MLVLLSALSALGHSGRAALANGYDFDDGTVQNWTVRGAYDPSSGAGPFSTNFSAGWSDSANYPEPPGSDPVGNSRGSLQMYTGGDHGIDNPGATWWLMQLHSPDLSNSEIWQKASGYTVKIAECMGGGKTTLYANLFVRVYDYDQGRDRYFTNGVAVPLATKIWSHHGQDWSDEDNFPENFVIRNIHINIWGLMEEGSGLSGAVYLDDVIPLIVPPCVYVDDDGPGLGENGSQEYPFDTIQEGIDAARDGQTVIVLDGIYSGQGNCDIQFGGKAIIVRSENGPESCIVDCQGTAEQNHRGFCFSSNEDAYSVLKGFTITNGYADVGGAILCASASPTIVSCIIRGNRANHGGGGISCQDSSSTISNCMITANEASTGGGIHCEGGRAKVNHCTLSRNHADYGGGMCCTNSSAELVNSILWNNVAGLGGAEIALKGPPYTSTLAVSYSDVAGGSAGAYIDSGCTLTWGPGNIDIDPLLTADKNRLCPQSPCIDAGEPTVDYTDQLDIDYAPRVFNGRVDIGADEFSPLVRNVTQDTYHATIQRAIDGSCDRDVISVPDGIYTGAGNRDMNFRGKAITVRSENGPDNCIIDCHGTEQTMYRGFSFNNNEDANSILMGFTITNGYEIQGGGIWCIYSDPTIVNCRFSSNIASDAGGGLYCFESSPRVSNCTFIANTADWGGGIYCKQSKLAIGNCTFTRNTADWGGAIYCTSGSDLIVSNCILWGNIASKGGTEITLRSADAPSTVTISYSDVAGGSSAVYTGSGCLLNWGPNNVDVDPLLTPDGHLRAGSPCIDAGGGINLTAESAETAESLFHGDAIDIGCDEFVDTDGDGLPDWWENQHFGSSTAVNPDEDSDGDGLTNLQEYELYGSDPNTRPYYVNANTGDDFYNGLASVHTGQNNGPKKSIQAGLNVARDGDTIVVAAGTYKGSGNTFLDFAGKSVVLHAPDGPASTSIDCEHVSGCAFIFQSNETPATAVVGFTIANVLRTRGRAVVCWNSHPQIRNCVISGNADNKSGGSLYCYSSLPILADCEICSDSSDGVWIAYGGVQIVGTVRTTSVDWMGTDLVLYGDGTLQMQSDVILDLDDSRIRCNVSGPGTILVDLGSELIIEKNSVVDLGHETGPNGRLVCDGLLRLKDDASIIDAEIYVNRASFEDNAIIVNCVINAEAGAPYGQFFVQDNVHVWLDKIKADGDRYLDLDPSKFDCNNIDVGAIEVDITEGVGTSYGGLFELRGRDMEVGSCDENIPLCRLDSVPDFGPNTWTIDKLELVAGAKLNLTNRFDFQAPYDAGGDYEVLYVKDLILGPGSVLNLAFNRLYYENLTMDSSAQIINVPLLGFSLHVIGLDDENDFLTRVKHNNFEHPENPGFDRIHVERVEGLEPDPNGMMRMCNLLDEDPDSPCYGQVVNARAKGLFAKSSETEILIRFEYLFDGPSQNGELLVYLSDTPELLDRFDPRWDVACMEVARVSNPSGGRPGSVGSGRFATFEKVVPTGLMNFTKGTRIEFELVGPEQTSILINDWDPGVLRCTMKCGDVAGALHEVNAEDFLAAISECGRRTDDPSGTASGDLSCVDGFFCADGYVTIHDAMAIDFIAPPCPLTNLCPGSGILSSVTASSFASNGKAAAFAASAGHIFAAAGQPAFKGQVLVLGKAYRPGDPWGDFLSDCLYGLDQQGDPASGPFAMESHRANSKVVKDALGRLYQINLELGLIRLCEGSPIVVPSGTCPYAKEPRYGQAATICVGFQERDGMWVPPILDAAFDADGHVYVAPVVVVVPGHNCYSAVGKLQLRSTDNPPYEVVQLFYDSGGADEQEHRDNLREIEVDKDGYLYAINVCRLNENDILWVCDTSTGTLQNRLVLNNPSNEVRIPAPAGMCISNTTGMLYLGSSLNQPDARSTMIYAIPKDDLVHSSLSPSSVRSIEIEHMGHLTDITEDPSTGTLWVVGFSMPQIPSWPQNYYMPEQSWLSKKPFYEPRLAKIPRDKWEGAEPVGAQSLSDYSDPAFELAMPLSVVWIATRVDLADFAILAGYWRDSDCLASDRCVGADLNGSGAVDMIDLTILVERWLEYQ